MDIYFTNTLTKQKEKFKPIRKDEVRIYSCGPTVYKDATIGNMRTNIFQDVLQWIQNKTRNEYNRRRTPSIRRR